MLRVVLLSLLICASALAADEARWLSVRPYWLKKGTVDFVVNVGRARTADAKQLRVTVTPEVGGDPVAQTTVPIGDDTSKTLTIDAAPWTVGRYVARAELLGGNGAVLDVFEEKFEKPATPKWFTDPEGLTPEVPEPWRPVRSEPIGGGRPGALVHVWGRTYKFTGLPVPASIIATPQKLSDAEPEPVSAELLAGPIELNLTIGGKKLDWITTSFERTESKPGHVIYASENAAGEFVLNAKTTVEFDGMIRVDLSLEAADGEPQPLESLELVIPLRKEIARVLSSQLKAPGPGEAAEDYHGDIPQEPRARSVSCSQFLGNDKLGLEWFCDDLRGWRLEKPNAATQIDSEEGAVIERFRIVDHATKVEQGKPIAITFGLIATPTKPARRGWEVYRFDHGSPLPPQVGEIKDKGNVSQDDMNAWQRRAEYSKLQVNLDWIDSWCATVNDNAPEFPLAIDVSGHAGKVLKEQIEVAHTLGQKVIPGGRWYMTPHAPSEWSHFRYEMTPTPDDLFGGPAFACHRSAYADLVAAGCAANAKGLNVDGVRVGASSSVECQNLDHGCGWRSDGVLFGSLNLFARRELFKRMYRVFHGGEKEEGYIFHVADGRPVMAFESFVDVHEFGDRGTREISFNERIPQSEIRFFMTGAAYGLITTSNLASSPLESNERIGALIVAGADPTFHSTGTGRGYQRLPVETPNTVELWNAWRWIDRGRTALWMPYWENSAFVKTAALRASGADEPETYTSFYYVPGKKVLLIVAQYEPAPLTDFAVTLDLVKLGFRKDDKLFGEDAITLQPVDVDDGSLRLGLLAQRYRVIQLSLDTPRYHESRLGDNLLPEGTFEKFPGRASVTQPAGQVEPGVSQDASVRLGGKASLKLVKTGKEIASQPRVGFAPVAVEPGGRYLVSGYVKIDRELEPAVDAKGVAQPSHSYANVKIDGENIVTDPPREFAEYGGQFPIGEPTPGWLRFMLPFEAKENAKTVSVEVNLQGVGTVWFDEIKVQRVEW